MEKQSIALEMAASIMERTPNLSGDSYNHGNWAYGHGVVLNGYELLWKKTGDRKYFEYIFNNIDPFINEDGSINTYCLEDFHLDNINNGKLLFILYQELKDEKYKKAIELLHQQIIRQPRTSDGVFWHKEIYPSQIWLDGLYMGAPYYAKYATFTNQPILFEDVMQQFDRSFEHLFDKNSGLMFHAYDEARVQTWSDKSTGVSHNFWTRSIGWYLMALVDTYEILPEEYLPKKRLIKYLKLVLEGLMEQQDSVSRCWFQVTDQQSRKGNYLEASGSSMVVYALAKGLRINMLSENHWYRKLRFTFEGVADQFITRDYHGWLNLNQNCKVAGLGASPRRDGSYAYYISEPIICNDHKGLGAFLQAAVEAENILNGGMKNE